MKVKGSRHAEARRRGGWKRNILFFRNLYFSALPRLRVNFRFQIDEGPQSVGKALPSVFEEQKDQGEQQEQLPHRAEEEDVEVESFQNKDDQKSRSNERDETG